MVLAEAHGGGDPITGGKWVRRSLRHLAGDLRRQGHAVGLHAVRRLLRKHNYSLRSNVKRLSGPRHPQREQQFQYIHRQRRSFTRTGCPVLSIDAKKKELVGRFKNPGRTWTQKPEQVNAYDFIHDALCLATPYGLYGVNRNRGHLCVGTSAETGAFAADALQGWWRKQGRRTYPQANRLLLLADSGGGNGCRVRLWKQSLQEVADRTGLALTVCHYPTGASKWNPVEHRLFAPISINWAGVPLRSLETMLACIRGTGTNTGLKVTATLMDRTYEKKIKVSDEQMRRLQFRPHKTCPQWNYTIRPRSVRSRR